MRWRFFKIKKNVMKKNKVFTCLKETFNNNFVTVTVKKMIKPRGKNKKIDDTLLLINNDPILKKELKSIAREDSVDKAYLKIQNDNEFVLKTKEKTDKIATLKNYLKTNSKNSCTESKNQDNNEEKSNIICDEIIDIKCTPKTFDENTPDDESIFNCENNIKKCKNNVTIFNPTKSPRVTNDLKSDLQSLLIMIAISSSCHDNDKPNHTIQDYDNSQNNYEIVKKPITNTNTLQNISDNNYEITNLLNIQSLTIPINYKISIVRKYAYIWMDYVKKQKEKKSHCERLENINKFLQKLEQKKISANVNADPANKARLQARDFNTFQHRYKIQKHIIALQKAKLEQQNRLIEELKYNKITEASRQSLDNMKEDVKRTYYDIDKHLKPKIKCLTNELKIPEVEEQSLILHCLKVPQFLQRMEARAREREEKHAIIRERRKQLEEERIRLKQQAEIAKAEMDKEEKFKRITELREKRRREKIENIRKKQQTERLRALIVMADLHYEKSLMAKYGIRPLKLLIELKRDNIEKAKAHCEFQLKKNVFLRWMWHTEDMWYERNYKAEDFSRKKLLRKAFNCFKENHNAYLIKVQVAKDYYDLYVTKLVFKGFQQGIQHLKNEFNKKWNNAIIYHNSNLLFKTLTCWRTLPALNTLKREQDARKLRWRQKVLQVVPDYEPPEEYI